MQSDEDFPPFMKEERVHDVHPVVTATTDGDVNHLCLRACLGLCSFIAVYRGLYILQIGLQR